MKKIQQFLIAFTASLFLVANTAPPIVYANETNKLINEQQMVEQKLSQPLNISEEQLDQLIQNKKALYPDLNENQMREIAYQAMSPYTFKANVLDGKGVTLSEFAWAFDVIVGGLISGYATIGKYAAKHGVAAAKAMLSRAAKAAAQRVGVLTGFISGLLGAAFSVINIYYNVGYALAQYIDARDYHPNNGRINAWA
ncbi:Uncharacterised protein [Chlamydia trachomatis]|nr:Uncharacterised protein [Chlamydia trachomatis]CRH91922.1 Uncharacterised protein [Chlamydia trachomatis]